MTVFETGIDVSRYQGEIDWEQVAASGRQFAIVRLGTASRNGVYRDPSFLKNVEGAHRAGLKAGAYFYTRSRSQAEVIAELQVWLEQLQGLRLEYPVFVDAEDASLTDLDRETLTGLVQFAMDILYQEGWYGGYYTYTNFAHTYLDTDRLKDYPLWIADYRGSVGFQGRYALWQYSGAGQVRGIQGPVDLDRSYQDFLPLLRAGGFNGYGQESCENERKRLREQLARARELARQTRRLAEQTEASLKP